MNQFLSRLAELTDEADLLCSPQSVGQSGEATLQCFVSAGCSSLGPSLFRLTVHAACNAAWRTQNLTHLFPVDVWIQCLAPDSCKLLDIQAALHRNAARHPVGYGLRFDGFASGIREAPSELRNAVELIDGIAKGGCARMGGRCLDHAHKHTRDVSMIQAFCEFYVSPPCEPQVVSDCVSFIHG